MSGEHPNSPAPLATDPVVPVLFSAEWQTYEDLTEAEQAAASNNGRNGGKQYAKYLRVTHHGKTLLLENDAMEPEDATFYRDLSWVKDMIKEAYMLGYRDAADRYGK